MGCSTASNQRYCNLQRVSFPSAMIDWTLLLVQVAVQIWLKPSGWDALDDCRRHVAAARTERARLGAPSSPGSSSGGGGGSEGGEERDASELEAVARRCVLTLIRI